MGLAVRLAVRLGVGVGGIGGMLTARVGGRPSSPDSTQRIRYMSPSSESRLCLSAMYHHKLPDERMR